MHTEKKKPHKFKLIFGKEIKITFCLLYSQNKLHTSVHIITGINYLKPRGYDFEMLFSYTENTHLFSLLCVIYLYT